MIKGIIFDYGATIDSNGKHWASVIYEGYRAAGIDIPMPLFREAYVHGERALAKHPHIMPEDDFGVLLRKKIVIQFDYLYSQGCMPADVGMARNAIVDYCYDYARRCVTNARKTLDALKEKYPMVLVSNFYGNIGAVLADYNLTDYFGSIIESAVVGVRKPDPKIFQLGVDALSLSPREVLVVGDSYRKDILPAKQIGCRTIWLKGEGWDDDEKEIQDGMIITDFEQLLPVIEDL